MRSFSAFNFFWHSVAKLVSTKPFCDIFCSLYPETWLIPNNRGAIRFQERVISANYFMKKWNDVLIKTALCILMQNMDAMLFLRSVPKREMINCRHVPVKVFGKYFDSQKLYVKTSRRHHFYRFLLWKGCGSNTSDSKYVICRTFYLDLNIK